MAESLYSSSFQTFTPQPGLPGYSRDHPPPPPPKPTSHDPSRTGTPSSPTHASLPNLQQSQYAPPVPPPHIHVQGYGSHQHLIQTNMHPSSSQDFRAALPPVDSGWLPEGLQEKTTSDLQPLLQNSDLLTVFAHQHPAFTAATEQLQSTISDNLKLAEAVATLENKVIQARDQAGQLLLQHTSLQTQWRRKQREMDDALSPWGPRALYQRLVASIAEQEQLLRAVHDSFLEGGGGGAGNEPEFYSSTTDGKASEKEVSEWIKRIREGTTTLEKRKEMRARWDEGRISGWR